MYSSSYPEGLHKKSFHATVPLSIFYFFSLMPEKVPCLFFLFSTPSPFPLFCTFHCVPHDLFFPFLFFHMKVLSFHFLFLSFLAILVSYIVHCTIHLNTISYSFINCSPSVIYSLFYEGAINKSQKLVIYFSLAHNGTVFCMNSRVSL